MKRFGFVLLISAKLPDKAVQLGVFFRCTCRTVGEFRCQHRNDLLFQDIAFPEIGHQCFLFSCQTDAGR